MQIKKYAKSDYKPFISVPVCTQIFRFTGFRIINIIKKPQLPLRLWLFFILIHLVETFSELCQEIYL